MDIDHGRSYNAIQEDLGDFEEFASSMAPLLQSSQLPARGLTSDAPLSCLSRPD
jgi:hypothetical protein